jgi:hypothetical protein
MSEHYYQHTQQRFDIGNIKYVDPASQDDYQERQLLLQKVKVVVEQSLRLALQNTIAVGLTLAARPDLIANTPASRSQETGQEASIWQSYEYADGDLLILGESGAGKTVLLEELAYQLIQQAEKDGRMLTPILLNLASWATRQLPLEKWLIEELTLKYLVPPDVGQRLIEEDQLRLLLDGLDEVRENERGACIQAVNNYKADHTIPVTVCGGTTEYLKTGVKLRLQEAFIVQPLSLPQIQAALSQAGPQFAPLQAILRTDIILQHVFSTPLMLHVLFNIYQDQSQALDLEIFNGSADECKARLWSHYTAHMVKRWNEQRTSGPYYHEQKVQEGLAWLAWQMKQHHLTELYLHQMRIDWFEAGPVRWYPRLVKIGPVRFMLWRTKVISWGYVSFLNHLTHMHLLRHIGEVYTFMHRQLLEYFARLYTGKSPSLPLPALPSPSSQGNEQAQDVTVRVLPQQSRLCPNCRFALPIQAKFCGRCGAKL